MRPDRSRLKTVLKAAQRAVLPARSSGSGSPPTVSPNIEADKDYEKNWAPVLASIQAVVQQESTLSRAIGRLTLSSATSPLNYAPVSLVSSGQVVPISAQGALGIYGDILVRSIFDMCRDGSADNIIELGSGWGHYLFKLWMSGAPKDAHYYAFELTKTGLECASTMRALEPGMRLHPIRFDFRAPDYSRVTRAKKTLVYTSHSIEQVQTLPREAIMGVLETADQVEGLHLEPVGWQVRHQRGERLPAFSAQQERRCQKYQYNENLWALLLGLQAEGRIAITECVPDIIGVPHNPSTLIRWSTR